MKPAWLQKLFRRIPELTTERLILRRIRVADTADMYTYSKRADVTKYLLWDPHPSEEYTREYTTYLQSRYREGELYDWAITLRESGKMIGTCGFAAIYAADDRAEIGYVINPDFSSRGYASEAVAAVLAYGFSALKLNRIEARCFDANAASIRVMEKNGFLYEGTGRQSMKIKGEYQDIRTYAILAEEYRSSERAGAVSV